MILFRVLFLLFFLFLPVASFLEAKDSPVDLLVFASAPGEETLGCGITISKAVKDNKRVKVVFLTNGGNDLDNPARFSDQESPGTLEKYVELGQRYQSEALRAAKMLGLVEEDVIFLNYPAGGLRQLFEEEYNYSSPGSKFSYDLFRCPATKASFSSYKNTYGKAKSGYSRSNIISDIKEIIEKNKPKKIYLPSPWDSQADRIVSANLINKALNELMIQRSGEWIYGISVFYYTINLKVNYPAPINFQENKNQEGASNPEYELFWQVPGQKNVYLDGLYAEWLGMAKKMKGYGYSVNLGVVADVAGDVEDSGIDLVKKSRIFSDDSVIVWQLIEKIAQGLNAGGIVPVVKHFPGLGSSYFNTHQRLATVSSSQEQLWKKDFFPYRKLIERSIPFWVMINHAVYPSIDENPASLSYKIQTGLLRNKLGFKGIIISDDLMQMRSLEEYALQRGFNKSYIGEIAVMAFAAGTDIVIIYPAPGKAVEVISEVIAAVKNAVKEVRLSESQINSSLIRILKEKERIFNVRLTPLVKNMTLEEKICQKILIDVDSDIQILNDYCLGAIHARDHAVIENAQKKCRIPLFIVGQHEGGRVIEVKRNLNSSSPYLIGREYERALGPNYKRKEFLHYQVDKKTNIDYVGNSFYYGRADVRTHQAAVDILCTSLDEDIKAFAKRKNEAEVSLLIQESVSMLVFPRENLWAIRIKPFKELPMASLAKFPDKFTAVYAYKVFKQAFESWQNKAGISGRIFKQAFEKELNESEISRLRMDNKESRPYEDLMISSLSRLKSEIQQVKVENNTRPVRVLCLAAHPDDEDAEAMVYFKQEFNAQTYILLATRGEAGENQIGSQLYEELGALRTEEAEKAAALLGVKKVYFLGKNDFGYCRDPKEALLKWNKENTLFRLVYFYRLIKPDIIITKHNSTQSHCQHQALISLGQEAFDLAGEAKAYPQMVEYGLAPWQPTGFYQRRALGSPGFIWNDLVIDAQEKPPSLDQTYNDLGRQALEAHRSQNIPWFPSEKIEYELVKAAECVGAWGAEEYSLNKKNKEVASGLPGVKIIRGINVGLVEDRDNVFFVGLKTLGSDLQKIDSRFLAEGGLSGLDTIILGKGADKVIASVKDTDKRILDFVANGGNLVVFFLGNGNKEEKFPFLPYPLGQSQKGVFDENFPVRLLSPGHPLFNFPNKISPRDFSGWVQDRARFFFSAASEKYVNLLSCLNPSGGYVQGGYLVSFYGKGTIIATTLAWYRQLREFHLGTYKNLANMISYPYTRETSP